MTQTSSSTTSPAPAPPSPACSAFLQRVEDGVLRGLTSTVVLIEVLHRLMILEAVGSLRLHPREATRYLKGHPEHVKSLHVHHRVPERIRQMGVEVVSVGLEEIEQSHEAKARYEERPGLATLSEMSPMHCLSSSISSVDSVTFACRVSRR